MTNPTGFEHYTDDQLEDARVEAGEAYQESEDRVTALSYREVAEAIADEQAARAYRRGQE